MADTSDRTKTTKNLPIDLIHKPSQHINPSQSFSDLLQRHDGINRRMATTTQRSWSMDAVGADGERRDDEITDPRLLAEVFNCSDITKEAQDSNGTMRDERDAWGFGSRATQGSVAAMPVEKDSEVYNMNHRRRGCAFVFNHKHFDHRLGLKQRNGTDADRDNLKNTLKQLDFEVKVYEDLAFKEIDRILCGAAADNHSDADCILVAVLSHGELGILYASDHAYKPDQLWTQFNAERCPTLAGKPKLFFIQACQGDQLDSGVHMKKVAYTETDSSATSYKIPTHADFLIVYSTIPGFYSWRNTSAGSWFIQALCYILQSQGKAKDLLSNLTHVSRKVAFDFQSNTPGDYGMHEKKQIPCITSMLTRDIFFPPKV